MNMSDKVPSLDSIPNVLGYMVLEEDLIVSSGGDIDNNEEVAKLLYKIAYTAAKIPVNPDNKDSFKRISMVLENRFVYMMTIANGRIYLVKRAHVAEENL